MPSIRHIMPSCLTAVAICFGVTAIYFSFERKLELAVSSVLLAVVFDFFDGRLARSLSTQSQFGAELDSLADFANFGVAPAILLHTWSLHMLGISGWFIVLLFVVGSAFRVARHNVTLVDPQTRSWSSSFFIGVPTPAGAVITLLPAYLYFLGLFETAPTSALWTGLYMSAVALLMVSRLPTFTGKNIGLIPKYSAPLFYPRSFFVILIIMLFVFNPWLCLSVASVCYLSLIPFSVRAFRRRTMPGQTAP